MIAESNAVSAQRLISTFTALNVSLNMATPCFRWQACQLVKVGIYKAPCPALAIRLPRMALRTFDTAGPIRVVPSKDGKSSASRPQASRKGTGVCVQRHSSQRNAGRHGASYCAGRYFRSFTMSHLRLITWQPVQSAPQHPTVMRSMSIRTSMRWSQS